MKKFFSLLAMLFSFATYAQDAATASSFADLFDSHTAGLIESRVPFGVLYNRVYPWAALDQWQDGDTLDDAKLRQAWFELALSHRNANIRSTDSTALSTALWQADSMNVLPLLAIYQGFGIFDSLAVQDGRLAYDTTTGNYTDLNQAQTPYQKRPCGFSATSIFFGAVQAASVAKERAKRKVLFIIPYKVRRTKGKLQMASAYFTANPQITVPVRTRGV